MNDLLNKLTPERIGEYQEHLGKSGVSEATIKRRVSALSKFKNWAKKEAGKNQPQTANDQPRVINNQPPVSPSASPFFFVFRVAGIAAIVSAVVFLTLTRLLPKYEPVSTETASQSADSPKISRPTPSPKAIESTIPVVDKNGAIVLEGEVLALQTTTASDGNINIAPDGSGTINLLLNAGRGQAVRTIDANLGVGGNKEDNSLYYGYVGNDNQNYYLLQLKSGSTPKTRFNVDGNGNTTVGGTLRAATVGIANTNPRYPLDVGGETRIGGTIYNLYDKPIKSGNDAFLSATGWHRIAKTSGQAELGSGQAELGSGRASGLFNIMDMTDNRQQSIYFLASVANPDGNNRRQLVLNLISNVRHDQNIFSKIRFVRKGETDPVYLEVYLESPVNDSVRYIISQNDWDNGWEAIDWSKGEVPADYSPIEYPVTDVSFGTGQGIFVINNDGNIGVGTNTPTNKLDVAGTMQMTGFKLTASPTAGYSLISDANGVGSWTDVSSTAGPWTLSGTSLYPDSASYNVGIGNTSPGSYRLNISGNTYLGGNLTSTGTITFSNLGTGVVQSNSSGVLANVLGTANYFPKWTASGLSTTSLIYDDGTNVGIGTTGPVYKLDAAGTLGVSSTAYFASSVGIGTTSPIGPLQINNGATAAFVVTSASQVGIGTTSPRAKLHSLATSEQLRLGYDSSNYVSLSTNAAGDISISPNENTGGLTIKGDATSPNIIGGHSNNTISGASVYGAFIGGGGEEWSANQISSVLGAIVGGYNNNITSTSYTGFIGGGRNNTVSAGDATVVGGDTNTASGDDSFVGGGLYHIANGSGAAILGGYLNVASGSDAAVGGGASNQATGEWSTVPGGYINIASGNFSFAAGRQAKATANGTFAMADSTNADFTVNTVNVFGARFSGGYWLTGGNVGIGTTNPAYKLDVSGNFGVSSTAYFASLVGIGTTAPAASLDVASTAWLRGTGTSGLFVNSSGNVGIGTTSPTSGYELDVAGECVAEDSLVPVARDNFDLIFKQIKDVKPGNYVLSLNEATGSFEFQRVEKTLDKGRQEVYELITETGKRIETTGNHPYLVKNQKTVSFETANLVSLASLLNDRTVNLRQRLTNADQFVKSQNLGVDPPGVEPGKPGLTVRSSKPAEPTPRPLFQNEIQNSTWTKVIYLNIGDEIATLDEAAEGNTSNGGAPSGDDSFEVKESSVLQWEKIASIKKTGIKHVYDLQIENTHNFVANGIVAHNTYIHSSATANPALAINASGALTSGNGTFDLNVSSSSTTIPGLALAYAGSGLALRINDDGTYTDTSSFVIDASGNVGIGTTNPAYKLDVSGNFGVSSTAYFASLVGIGTTAPGQALEVNGRIRMTTWTADGDVAVYKANATGDIGVTSSDIRLKKNLEPLDNFDVLGIISNLNTYLYNPIYEADGSKKRLGVIAQDFLPVMPELTFNISNNDGGEQYYGVHYEKLSVLALEAIKRQQKQIADLATTVADFAGEKMASLKAGLIETGELIADSVTVNREFVSPLVKTSEIRIQNTEFRIKNSAGETAVEIAEDKTTTHFGDLIVQGAEIRMQNAEGETTTEITPEGAIKTQEIEVARDATVSGTLYADNIVAKNGTFGQQLAEDDVNALVNQILADAANESNSNNTNLNTYSELDIKTDQQTIESLAISKNLTAVGATNLANTTIGGSLNIGGTLILADNTINGIGTLYLNPLGLGGVDILSGKIKIDEKGNAVFGGDVTVEGKLYAKSGATFGELLVKGTATFNKLVIATDNEASQSAIIGNNEISTNATAGRATLKANETEITIKSPFVTESSLIYLTPASKTENKVLYVEAKKAAITCANEDTACTPETGWFKVAIDSFIANDIEFNWWVIN